MSSTIRMLVVLPAPLAPSRPKMRPGSTVKLSAVERDDLTESLGDGVNDQGH